MLTVYHGATCIVEKPLCHIGRDNLDFGKGFYVTDLKEQAISWATRFVLMGYTFCEYWITEMVEYL